MSYGIQLLKEAPKDTRLFTVVRYVSRSGMMRVIDVFMLVQVEYVASPNDAYYSKRWDLQPIRIFDKKLIGFRYDDKRDGYIVHGTGMDMAFHLVYELGRAIHQDGTYFRKERI